MRAIASTANASASISGRLCGAYYDPRALCGGNSRQYYFCRSDGHRRRGTDERVELGKGYGADLGINYRKHDLAIEVMRLTADEGVNVVCDNISDPTLWPAAFNTLAMAGRMVTAGAHGDGIVALDIKQLYMRRLRIIGAAGTNLSDVEKALDAACQ
jgi:NADPH:quinone reductase-like Zn-dependent oxidoreductase